MSIFGSVKGFPTKSSEDLFNDEEHICIQAQHEKKICALENTKLNEMRKFGKFCDVSIKCTDDESIYKAHKVILASRSKYFMKTFEFNELNEKEINLLEVPKIKGKELDKILTFIYTKQLSWTKYEEYKEIFLHARYFEIRELEEICFKRIISNYLNIFVFLDLWRFSVKESIIRMETKVISFILDNFREVIESPYATKIEVDELEKILNKIHQSSLSEEEIFKYVMKWSTNKFPDDKENRKKALSMLLRLIEFDKMKKEFLLHEVLTHEELQDENNSNSTLLFIRELVETECIANSIDINDIRRTLKFVLLESTIFHHLKRDENICQYRRNLKVFCPSLSRFYCCGTQLDNKICLSFPVAEKRQTRGMKYSQYPSITMKLYFPETQSWKDFGNKNDIFDGFRMTSFNKDFYLCSGNNIYKIDAATGCWSNIVNLINDHYFSGFTAVNQNLFIIGGDNRPCILTYDPKEGKQSQLPVSFPYASRMKCVVKGELIYCFRKDNYCTFDVRNHKFSPFIKIDWGRYDACSFENKIYIAYRKNSFINICNLNDVTQELSILDSIRSDENGEIFMLELINV